MALTYLHPLTCRHVVYLYLSPLFLPYIQLVVSPPAISSGTFVTVLRMLSTLCSACPPLAVELLTISTENNYLYTTNEHTYSLTYIRFSYSNDVLCI